MSEPLPTVDEVDAVARRVRAAEDDARVLAAKLKRAQTERDEARAQLLAMLCKLGPGTLAMATDTVYLVELGHDGAAVEVSALRRHADLIAPLGLAPREVTVEHLPGVTELRRKAKALRALGLDVREFLDEGPVVPKLRSRQRKEATG